MIHVRNRSTFVFAWRLKPNHVSFPRETLEHSLVTCDYTSSSLFSFIPPISSVIQGRIYYENARNSWPT